MDIQWWEKKPVRFECQPDCFKCCAKPGFVYMNQKDVRQAAEFLNLSQKRFKSEFLKKQYDMWYIEVEDDNPCPFLTFEGCAIHEAKPVQCKTYPFWRENMETPKHWELTASFCPGIGKGSELLANVIKKAFDLFKL
jgi:Fe-S-cluster containining protein